MSAPACIDICALDSDNKYLILKDGRYVKIRSLQDKLPTDPDSWSKPLHECCRDGDHYMGYYLQSNAFSTTTSSTSSARIEFYIIYRNRDYNLTEVLNVNRLEPTVLHNLPGMILKNKLSHSYRGGDFYLSKRLEFYVVFKESNTFLRTTDLSKEPAVQIQHHQLHKELCNGLYYFATDSFIYVVIADGDNNLIYRRTPDLQSLEGETGAAIPIDQSVAEVLRNGVQLRRRPWKNHDHQDTHSATCCCSGGCRVHKRPAEERSRLQLGVAGTLGGLVGGAIGAIIGLLVGGVIFATVDAADPGVTFSIGATVGSAVCTAIGAVLFCLIYYFYTCN